MYLKFTKVCSARKQCPSRPANKRRVCVVRRIRVMRHKRMHEVLRHKRKAMLKKKKRNAPKRPKEVNRG